MKINKKLGIGFPRGAGQQGDNAWNVHFMTAEAS